MTNTVKSGMRFGRLKRLNEVSWELYKFNYRVRV